MVENQPSKKSVFSRLLGYHATLRLFAQLIFDHEDGSDMFFRNASRIKRTAYCYIPQDRTRHIHRCQSLKS
jgi:hypothetical protein